MEIAFIDHVAITVRDVERSSRFYVDVLGAETPVTHLRNGKVGIRKVVMGGAVFNLHQADNDFELIASHPSVGAADICLRWTGTIDSAAERLKAHNVPIVDGPSPRRTNDGLPSQSVYFHDPDGNLIELMAADPA